MNEDLLDILVCPKSGGKLEYDKTKNELICNYIPKFISKPYFCLIENVFFFD